MYVVAVTVYVKPEFVEQFKVATLDNASNSRKEPGNLRFDVLQGEDDPTRFFLYEVYKAPEDFVAHQNTAHFHRWKPLVADWMAQPRAAAKYHTYFYGESKT